MTENIFEQDFTLLAGAKELEVLNQLVGLKLEDLTKHIMTLRGRDKQHVEDALGHLENCRVALRNTAFEIQRTINVVSPQPVDI